MFTLPKLQSLLDNFNPEIIPEYASRLKQELELISPDKLPLYKLTTQGGVGMVSDEKITVIVSNSMENNQYIDSKVGLFFNEVIGGCSCGDEPYMESVYAEVIIRVKKQNAEVDFVIV